MQQFPIALSLIANCCLRKTKQCADELNYKIPAGDKHYPDHALPDDPSIAMRASGHPLSKFTHLEPAKISLDQLKTFVADAMTTKGLS